MVLQIRAGQIDQEEGTPAATFSSWTVQGRRPPTPRERIEPMMYTRLPPREAADERRK